MGLIPQVKCGRCDRTYSGLRSRCPYCGAHRHKKGKRVSDGDNATWKLIIGILLIVVLIAAVVVILVTSAGDKKPGDGEGGKNPPSSSNEGVDGQPGTDPNGTPSTPTTQITVTGADGAAVTDLALQAGGTAELTASVTPETVTGAPTWISSNEAVVKATPTDETGKTCTITYVADGTAKITVAVGGATYDINVTCGAAQTPGGEQNPDGSGSGVTGQVLAQAIKVKSRYYDPLKDCTLNKVGSSFEATAVITPSNVTSIPVWSCSDESIVSMVPTDDTNMKVKITQLVSGSHSVTITVSVDGITASFKVYTR